MNDTTESSETIASAAIRRYEAGETTYPTFVLELESAVEVAEALQDQRAHELRRLWGQLEIINALRMDASSSPDDIGEEDVDELIGAIRQLW